MPHYSDGTQAHVGDLVFGKPYNTPIEIVGQIVSITSNSDACNCVVAFVIEDTEFLNPRHPAYVTPPAVIMNDYNGDTGIYNKRVFKASTDYGAIKDYRLIKSAKPVELEVTV